MRLIDADALRLMTVEECAGHTIDYAAGWKACIDWINTLPTVEPKRERLFAALTDILTNGGGPGKSYDGEMLLTVEYPRSVYDDDQRPLYVIESDCYLIGPKRHYRWVSHCTRLRKI